MANATYRAGPPVKGQPAARRYQVFRDQHDRKWGAFIEIKTGDPTGEIQPIGWQAPLMPPQKFIHPVRDPDTGQPEAGRLEIDYADWIRELRQAITDYQERLHFFATSLYGEKAGEMVQNPSAELRRYMRGDPPYWEPVYAAMRGDPWVLGAEGASRPHWAEKFFRPKAVVKELELDLDPELLAELEEQFAALTAKAPRPSLGTDVDAAFEQARKELEAGLRPGRDDNPVVSADGKSATSGKKGAA